MSRANRNEGEAPPGQLRRSAVMVEREPEIVLISDRIGVSQLAQLVDRFFTDMVKYVVDLGRGEALP